jgi:hypothetical protein
MLEPMGPLSSDELRRIDAYWRAAKSEALP